MALLRWCWENRDLSRYREIFTDDFRFSFASWDSAGDPYPGRSWTRDDELLGATHLFVGGAAEPPAASIALALEGESQPGTCSFPGKTYPWHQQIVVPFVTLEVTRGDGTIRTASGYSLFSLVRGDSALLPQELIARGFTPDPNRWYIERWDDMPDEIIMDQAPDVTAPATLTAHVGMTLTMDVTAQDPDGDPISSLAAVAPTGASFVPGFDNTTGTLTWTPATGDLGSRSVTFTAHNALSGSAVTVINVLPPNEAPVVSVVMGPSIGVAPLRVRVDASGSVDRDGSIVRFRFDFGDGASAIQSLPYALHTYGRGTFTATVTATDDLGLEGRGSATVTATGPNLAPAASLALSPTSGIEPLQVTADASKSNDPDGTIVSYRFDFGDGTSVTQTNPLATHTYSAGSWTATLTATDDKGAMGSAGTAVTVRHPNRDPVASMVLNPTTGTEPLLVRLDASGSSDADGTIASFQFDFGDGTILTQSAPVAMHAFGAGRWTASVTVTDNLGGINSVMTTLTVSPSNEPPVASDPSGAVALLKWCWNKRDAARYREVFTNDFRFAFGPGDPAGDPYPDHAWTRDDELLSATHVFEGGGPEPPAASVALSFAGSAQPGSSFFPGKPYPWHQQILIPSLSLEVTRGDGTTRSASGRTFFYLVRGDSAALPRELLVRGFKADSTRWYVEGWYDVPENGVVVDHAPVVTAPATVNAKADTPITINVTAQDPDGDAMGSLTAAGHGYAIFVSSYDHTAGSLTWTPSESDVGSRRVTFRAANTLSGSATTTIYVTSSAPNLVRNPSFETDTKGWGPYAGSTLLRVPGGNDGAYGLQVSGPPVINGSFGVNDSPDWIRPTVLAGQRYRYTARVRSTGSVGTAKLRVCEYRILTGAKLGQVTSTGVRLSPDWQLITVDYVTTSPGSTLDFQVRDFPAVPNEVFLTDNISIRDVTTAAAAEPWSGDPQSEWTADEEVALEPTLYPSPIHDSGFLGFSTSRPGALRVEILDLAGRRLRRLMDERDAPAGMHFVTIRRTGDDGGRLGTGIYFYRIETEGGVKTGRFVMLR